MATKIKAKKKAPDILDAPAQRGDIAKLTQQAKENPVLYAAVAGFILVCIVAGIVYRVGTQSFSRSAMTKFANAVETQDPALRAAEMQPLAEGRGRMAAQALYMMGEAGYEAKEYDKAKEVFERLRNEFPDSRFVPDAVEGLGAIAENAGQYDQAIAYYKEIIDKWPGSFARRRQQLNIGRSQEAAGNLKEAVQAYQDQVDKFPGSSFEKDAKSVLERLRISNPDLFPKEEAKPLLEAPAKEQSATQSPEAAAPGAPAAQTPETPSPAESAAPDAEEQAPAPQDEGQTTAVPSKVE